MKQICTRGGLLSLMILFVGLGLFAADHCGNQDFRGTYGLIGQGAVTVPGTPITGPFGRAGQAVSDGHGNVSFSTTASYNGLIFPSSFSGTYAVSPDCTIEFTLPPFEPVLLPADFRGVIADNKQEIRFMIDSPGGQTIHATLRKQNKNHCEAEDLSGSYVVEFTGDFIQPPLGGFVREGRLLADGRGSFTAATTANYNGLVIQSENISGTYTVGNDCTLVLKYGTSSGPITWTGSFIDNNQGAVLIISDPPGAAVVGTLKGQ